MAAEKIFTPQALIRERPEVGSAGTLANLRSKGRGPKYFKRGRKILYKESDVDLWLLENPVMTMDQHG
jgi:hypothetical protein